MAGWLVGEPCQHHGQFSILLGVLEGGQLDDLGPSNFAFSLMTRSGPVKHPLILVGGRPRASAQWFKGGL